MAEYGYGTIASIGADGFNTIDYSAMNKGVTPEFKKEAIINERESEQQGRAVYDDVEIVHIHVAGDSNSIHSTLVDSAVKNRFPEQYAHWKRTEEGRHITGTPLKMWPMASPSFIREMEAISIFSVDDLANIADVHVSRIPDGRVWRERALAWLKAAGDTAAESRFAAENERLRERLEALEGRLDPPPKPTAPEIMARRIASKAARSERMKAIWAARKEAAKTA